MVNSSENLYYDLLIIGAGPSGLACAIKTKQLALQQKRDISILVLEKGNYVGANIISGCVIDLQVLAKLIPDWQEFTQSFATTIVNEQLLWLSQKHSWRLPKFDWGVEINKHIISLSKLCQALADYAQTLGVEIYPGFAALAPIIKNEALVGVVIADADVAATTTEATANNANSTSGANSIYAKQIILAEGCRGSLTKQIISRFKLDVNVLAPQTYGLGIKEIWQVDAKYHRLGQVVHTVGYPLYHQAYGGGFIYHLPNNKIAIGLVAALDYKNPSFNPYQELQKLKAHPKISPMLLNGKRLEYGAKCLVEGGMQALPKLSFAGGVIIGDSAGMLNVAKNQGVANAIDSGIIAANSVYCLHLKSIASTSNTVIVDTSDSNFDAHFRQSAIYKQLYEIRNIRAAFKLNIYFGMLYFAFEHYLMRHKVPWTFRWRRTDRQCTQLAHTMKKIDYAVTLKAIDANKNQALIDANLNHNHNQANHLQLHNSKEIVAININKYTAPEVNYCPAAVYEVDYAPATPKLIIHQQNCLHCKACDIKDVAANINWTPPANGAGPQYSEM